MTVPRGECWSIVPNDERCVVTNKTSDPCESPEESDRILTGETFTFCPLVHHMSNEKGYPVDCNTGEPK